MNGTICAGPSTPLGMTQGKPEGVRGFYATVTPC
jgi:hypothetical protein